MQYTCKKQNELFLVAAQLRPFAIGSLSDRSMLQYVASVLHCSIYSKQDGLLIMATDIRTFAIGILPDTVQDTYAHNKKTSNEEERP